MALRLYMSSRGSQHTQATVEVLEANSSKSFYERMGASLIERNPYLNMGRGMFY
ncbi:hypothetical protein JCM19047_817 [Bacillus sp. JCM 19047]|nr:hypothetical protein JCM19047_817 [Bacillus sp. JCM 19047]